MVVISYFVEAVKDFLGFLPKSTPVPWFDAWRASKTRKGPDDKKDAADGAADGANKGDATPEPTGDAGAETGSAADGLGFRGLGFSDLAENRSFWRSGRPLGALKPSIN